MPLKPHLDIPPHPAVDPLVAFDPVDSDSRSTLNMCRDGNEVVCVSLLAKRIANEMSGLSTDTPPTYGCLLQCTFKNILSKIKPISNEASIPVLLPSQDLNLKLLLTLTPRESEILLLLASSDSAKVMAVNLNISKHTLNEHITNIYRKLSVTNRVAAINIK